MTVMRRALIVAVMVTGARVCRRSSRSFQRLAAVARAQSRRCGPVVHGAAAVAGSSWFSGGRSKWGSAMPRRLSPATGSTCSRGRARTKSMSALDADTGKVLWQTGYPAPFTMHSAAARHGPGPKSTPVFANGRLYAIGMTGVVTAFDAATGKQLWQKPGSRAGADVYEPRILAAGRRRAGHFPRGRPQQGSADGVRRRTRAT